MTLSRQRLAKLFSALSAAGKVIVANPADLGRTQVSANQIRTEQYWEDLITKFLRKEVTLDDSFRQRARFYL